MGSCPDGAMIITHGRNEETWVIHQKSELLFPCCALKPWLHGSHQTNIWASAYPSSVKPFTTWSVDQPYITDPLSHPQGKLTYRTWRLNLRIMCRLSHPLWICLNTKDSISVQFFFWTNGLQSTPAIKNNKHSNSIYKDNWVPKCFSSLLYSHSQCANVGLMVFLSHLSVPGLREVVRFPPEHTGHCMFVAGCML